MLQVVDSFCMFARASNKPTAVRHVLMGGVTETSRDRLTVSIWHRLLDSQANFITYTCQYLYASKHIGNVIM